MKNLVSVIWLTVAFIACKKDTSPKPQKFANVIVGHWIGDSTVYKSTYADGHVVRGPAIEDSAFIQFNSNGKFEKYVRVGPFIEDNTGINGGVYELQDSSLVLIAKANWGENKYKIISISDRNLVLYRVSFGNSPVSNERWHYYHK